MMKSLGWWRTLVALCVVLCIAFAVGANGQAQKTGPTFAIVDVQKVTSEYKDMKVAQSDLVAMQTRFQARLSRRENMPFLTEEEQKLLDDTAEKPPASRVAADEAKIKELTEKGQKLTSDYEALRQKPDKDLTEADRTRIKETEGALLKQRQQLSAFKEQLDNQFKEFGSTNQERLTKVFRGVVAKIAEQKAVSIVFDSQFALFAGTDLTASVIAELNKK